MDIRFNFKKRPFIPGRWEKHQCPLCSNVIGAYRNVFNQLSSKLYNHLISQHPHLVFQCGYGRGNELEQNPSNHQLWCNRMYQYFLSYDKLEQHIQTVHKNSFKEAERKIIFPQGK